MKPAEIREALAPFGFARRRHVDGSWSLRRTTERVAATETRLEMARAVRVLLGVTGGRFREHDAKFHRDIHLFYDFVQATPAPRLDGGPRVAVVGGEQRT